MYCLLHRMYHKGETAKRVCLFSYFADLDYATAMRSYKGFGSKLRRREEVERKEISEMKYYHVQFYIERMNEKLGNEIHSSGRVV